MRGTAVSLLNNRQDAEDAIQEALYTAWSCPTFRIPREVYEAYLK